MSRRALLTIASIFIAIGAYPTLAAAQNYPEKPLRIMVGASPGGGTDILARMLAEKFQAQMGQTVVVENRPGASNTIAAEVTATASPDGSTLLLATNTGQAIAPHLLKLRYDPLKDVQPVGLVAVMPNVLVVSSASPWRNVRELLAGMRDKPGHFKYASSGVGSTQHIAGEAFSAATNVKAVHIPYKGSSQAHIDLIAGNVEMMFDTTSSAMGQIRSGKLRPLALAAEARSPELPDVPTLQELGIKGADVSTWYGLFVTNGVSKGITDRLVAELGRSLALPEVQARIKGMGGDVGKLSVEQFRDLNRGEFERFGKLIRDAGIKAE